MLSTIGAALGLVFASSAEKRCCAWSRKTARELPWPLKLIQADGIRRAGVGCDSHPLRICSCLAIAARVARHVARGQASLGDPSQSTVGSLLVVAQVAVSLVLVMGAGLFLRT